MFAHAILQTSKSKKICKTYRKAFVSLLELYFAFFSPSFVLGFHIFSTPKASAGLFVDAAMTSRSAQGAWTPRDWILIHVDSTFWGLALFVHKLFENSCALCGSFWGLAVSNLAMLNLLCVAPAASPLIILLMLLIV